MKILYAGSFNPFHIGHKYVYDLACRCFGKDNVWLGIGRNKLKTAQQTERLLKPITMNILKYDGLTATVVKEKNFDILLRGIRPGKSLEYEEDLFYWNKKLSGVDTLLIPTPPEINQISSSVIRELDSLLVDVKQYIPSDVYERWKNNKPLKNVYFGKTCSGKTTYLKDQNVLNADIAIWNFLKITNKKNIQKHIKKAFYEKNQSEFFKLIGLIGSAVNWQSLFETSNNHDMPVIGLYWNFIPVKIRAYLHLIKLTTSDKNRKKFAKAKDKNQSFLKCADFHYIDPPYWDEERRIENV